MPGPQAKQRAVRNPARAGSPATSTHTARRQVGSTQTTLFSNGADRGRRQFGLPATTAAATPAAAMPAGRLLRPIARAKGLQFSNLLLLCFRTCHGKPFPRGSGELFAARNVSRCVFARDHLDQRNRLRSRVRIGTWSTDRCAEAQRTRRKHLTQKDLHVK